VHVHLLIVGALFIWPLVGIDPMPRRLPFLGRLLTIVVAVPFHAFVGVAIMSGSTLLAPAAYPSLDDQHRAGALLWASGELLSFVVATIVVRQWASAEHRAGLRDRREMSRPAGVPSVSSVSSTSLRARLPVGKRCRSSRA
jgi:cytochrome c oxidase assembly factor CtaG